MPWRDSAASQLSVAVTKFLGEKNFNLKAGKVILVSGFRWQLRPCKQNFMAEDSLPWADLRLNITKPGASTV